MRLRSYIMFFNFVTIQIIMLERVLQPTPIPASYQSSIDPRYGDAPSLLTRINRFHNDNQEHYYTLIGISALLCVITAGSFCYSYASNRTHEEGRYLSQYTVVQDPREVNLPYAILPGSHVGGINATNELIIDSHSDVSALPTAGKATTITDGVPINFNQ